ncbi:glycosyltransferase [Oceanispirochaeta crateris]|uniref:Glycosyltransferase n=1 Tax=Oceanispirochaeta crateris TaxID=2518645 RepID=A0A5C1QNE4_9SPIO|nr:glycosyltransferase family 4 protein [Oceanispirochaeta crateris]QEN08500.1 glycosyltransferase [Oceanispirochaeta crateris]
MKIACVGNFPPRECGIATFTKDVIDSLGQKYDGALHQAFVIAMNDNHKEYAYPEEVESTIRQDYLQDYLQAAKYINFSGADICLLQHEFGIYGGNSGVYILPLINKLKIPLVVIFHTVLKEPSYNEKNIIIEIGKRASAIVVMNSLAIDFLTEVYGVEKEKIHVIEHGVPEFDFTRIEYHKKKFKVENRKTLITFGLLSRNKGIETVINALPEVVKKHPDLLYIILGKTHPAVIRSSGEEYRNYLKLLVHQQGLSDNVFFDDRFLSIDDLLGYLSAADMYVTPYLNEAQITSGTLAYAVSSGTAVISTPYWHAKELLANDRGILFDFGNSEQLAEILNSLLEDPVRLKQLQSRAFEFGKKTSWPMIGQRYLKLFDETRKSPIPVPVEIDHNVVNTGLMPQFSLDHVIRMTDSTGILQHAKYIVPKFQDGYCLDDNARALLMTTMAYRQMKDPESLRLMLHYLSFIQYMQNDDGSFRNFLSYSRNYLDEIGSEDSFGRTIWALGTLIRFPPNDVLFEQVRDLFQKGMVKFPDLNSIRGLANSIIGVSNWMHRFPTDEGMMNHLRSMTQKLEDYYTANSEEGWHWYEPLISYDNGILPYSLLCSYEITGREESKTIAFESIDFLSSIVLSEGNLSIVGSDGWYHKGGDAANFDQQPLNAMAVVLMFRQAYKVEKDPQYLDKMFRSFMWFLGDNDLHIPLYDFETKGCNDGLKPYGVNRNQGAESTLAYLISHISVMSVFEQNH